ncbi:MAG: hypothetical protein OXG58_06755 [Gemmatimonadetes bacterium]|nr:hypothetical protein [Gemmatimonadota bacterium]MCY3942305.1 hypothetical protein [Gemmatimonadota bacterium]
MAEGERGRSEEEVRKAVEEWAETPARNPFYRGATPAVVGRALLGCRPAPPAKKVAEDPQPSS